MKIKYIDLKLAQLILLLIATINCYFIKIPNYEFLIKQNIITRNFQFDHHANSINQIKEGILKGQELNERQQTNLHFQMFLYPYRMFSYFDRANKKQYLLKKIAFQEFNLQETVDNQQKQQNKQSPSSIIDTEFDIRQCLFQRSPSNPNQQQQDSLLNKSCFNQTHLYSLIPDLLTILAQQDQQIQLQKINEEYFLLKVFANPFTKNQINSSLNINLYKINIHSYIYEARFILMKQLFEVKSNELKNLSNQIQSEKSIIQLTKELVTQNKQRNQQPAYKIKMKDYFNSQIDIWQMISEKHSGDFRNLFNFETSIEIGKSAKFDYTSTRDVFYLTKINQTICPLSAHDKKYDLFQGTSSGLNPYDNSKDYRCTIIKSYRIPFIQFQLPDPTQYYNQQDIIDNIKRVSLGVLDREKSINSSGVHNIMINLMTKQRNIEISNSKLWKQVRYSEIHDQIDDNDASNVFYLENVKVQIQPGLLSIYRSQSKTQIYIQKHCQLTFQPFLITSQKINNQLFVVCLEGSLCKIIDKQCQVISQVLLQNALGIEWGYKINYVGKQIISFIAISRRFDDFYQVIDAPVDRTMIQSPQVKTGMFLMDVNFAQIQPGVYASNLSVIDPVLKFKKIFQVFEIFPTFQQTTLQYQFNPPKLFEDNIFKYSSLFKQRFLDQTLKLQIEDKFVKYYVPNFNVLNHSSPVKILNMKNHSDFEQFFSDCKYDQEKRTVIFKKDWNGCKLILKTNSLMLVDPFEFKNMQHTNQNLFNQDKNSKGQKQTSKEENNQKLKQVILDLPEKKAYEIWTKESLDSTQNKMIVCSAHKNSPAYSKCRVSEYEVTQSFQQGRKKARFFFESSRYFQVYIFNQKFSTQSGNKSFLQVLQSLASQTFTQESKRVNSEVVSETKSQLKQFKILYSQRAVENKKQYDIILVDYEKQQLENLSKLLLITLCIVFPIFTVCCCVVCFKSYFQTLLIYYGIMRVQPSFNYPLSKLALKIKLKELQRNGYLSIHKNKRINKRDDELNSNIEIKYSAECCFCLQELVLNEDVIELYCKHEFHSVCFIEWVKNEPNTKCPLCKRAFTRSSLEQFKSTMRTLPATYSASTRTNSSILPADNQLQHFDDDHSNQIQMQEYEQ